MGASGRKRTGYLSRGACSEGRIPGALSARNKADADSAGESRPEGNQTLKADRSGLWQRPRQVDRRVQHVLKGMKAHERRRFAAANWLGNVSNTLKERETRREVATVA